MKRNLHSSGLKASLSILLLACSFVASAADDRPAYGAAIGAKEAKAVAELAVTEARSKGWRIAVAIVDNHGSLRHFEMIDDTQIASADVAIRKASSAAIYRRPTKTFQDGVNQGSASLLSLPGAIAIEGGLPLFVDGKVVGGIGISGMSSEQDGIIAAAATAALKPKKS